MSQLANIISQEIQALLLKQDLSIIGVCGLGGVGKSTVCRMLAGEDVIIFEIDWYAAYATNERRKRIQEALDSKDKLEIAKWENPLLWYDWPRLYDGLSTLRDKGKLQITNGWNQSTGNLDLDISLQLPANKNSVILCDGIYLLHPEIAEFLDRIVLLDMPAEVCLERAEKRDAHRSPKEYLDFKIELLKKYDIPYFEKYSAVADLVIPSSIER